MHTGESWRLGHRPALDGLRGVAVLLVLASHLTDANGGLGFHAGGAVGVEVFFTLSGFLITSLLLAEVARTGTVRLRRFYLNRALRLYPAMIVATLVLGVLAAVNGWGSLDVIAAVILYVANWAMVSGHAAGLLAPMWSLSIEEQFYLIWPLLFLAVRRWRHGVLVAAGVGIVVSTGLRFLLWDGGTGVARVSFGSDTQAAGLLVGCALAVLMRRGLPAVNARWIIPAGLGCLVALGFAGHSVFAALVAPTLVPFLTAALILACCQSGQSVLTGRVVRYVGGRSYALYLWHYGVILAVAEVIGAGPIAALVAVVLSFALAEASWRVVELPFLRLKRRSGDAEVVERRVDAAERGFLVADHADVAEAERERVGLEQRVGDPVA